MVQCTSVIHNRKIHIYPGRCCTARTASSQAAAHPVTVLVHEATQRSVRVRPQPAQCVPSSPADSAQGHQSAASVQPRCAEEQDPTAPHSTPSMPGRRTRKPSALQLPAAAAAPLTGSSTWPLPPPLLLRRLLDPWCFSLTRLEGSLRTYCGSSYLRPAPRPEAAGPLCGGALGPARRSASGKGR